MADKMIDKYKIVSVVGEGGMGKVYKAIHPTLKKHIVIKRLSISTAKTLSERFKREANVMMGFRHENIISVYDHFKHGKSYFIVMEHIDGISLEDLIDKKKKIPPLAAALIFREICRGLQYAHHKGVIHRDIKPDNVLISKNGDVKLFDFGIAMVEAEADKELTKTGVVMGTPSYMSPEQIKDAKHVDKRTDIYSMGIMLYQMVTGKKPYPGGFSAETIHKITKGMYVKPGKHVSKLPGVFKKVIKKTMHHKMNKRYADLEHIISLFSRFLKKYKTPSEINKAIKEYLHEAPGKESTFTKIPRSSGRSLMLKVAVAALVLVLAGGAVFLVSSSSIFYELFSGRDMGALELKIIVPDNYYKDVSEVYAKAVLTYYDEAAEKGEEKLIKYEYRLSPVTNVIPSNSKSKTEKKEQFLTTHALFLPAGMYDLELTLENRKYCTAFSLNPLDLQKQNPDTPEKRKIIQFNIQTPSEDKIPVFHYVKDGITGVSLNDQVEIYYKGKAGWADWKYAEEQLYRGRVYRIRYVAPSYYTREVEVTIENQMDSLKLDIDMIKKPGKLVLTSNAEGLEILLDNRREDYLGGKAKSFVEFGKTTKKDKTFLLEERDYMVTIKKNDEVFSNYRVKITSDSTTRLSISYNEKQKSINITE
ncbi:MAG: serine/threonine protein kinase [Spirochaetales bacterium]|nr:serine/threonine protein kinase [Spirochaetales bacterium]